MDRTDQTDQTDQTDRKATEFPGEPASRAMAAGREAPNPQSAIRNPQSGTSHDRAREHWQNHEIGYLLAMGVEGMPWDAIAQRLDRTPGGCEAMLRRLVTGQTPCNAEWSASLARAKTIYAAKKTEPGTGNPEPETTAAARALLRDTLDRVTAQYRALAADDADIRGLLNGVENLLFHGLACQIIAGEITAAEVSRFLGPNKARLAGALAFEIKQFRAADGTKTEPGARNKEQGERPSSPAPGSRFPTPGSAVSSPPDPDVPVVITGQGTSEHRVYADARGNLVDARPAGSLDVMG